MTKIIVGILITLWTIAFIAIILFFLSFIPSVFAEEHIIKFVNNDNDNEIVFLMNYEGKCWGDRDKALQIIKNNKDSVDGIAAITGVLTILGCDYQGEIEK